MSFVFFTVKNTKGVTVMGFPDCSVGKESTVDSLPQEREETQEMQVQSLCQEDSLEEEKATPSSILAWKVPWTEEPGGL